MLLLALCLSFAANAQNFPGEKIELLNGKNLKVLPIAGASQKYGYKDFYTDADLKNIYKKEGYSTPYDLLVGKEFKVVSYEPYKSYNEIKYKLLIENPETGKLYFDYNPKYSFTFPFEVIGGLAYPEGFFCESIVEKKGNVVKQGDKWYEAPMEMGIQLSRYKGQLNPVYMKITFSTDAIYDEKVTMKGYSIIFENGKTITKPAKQLISYAGSSGTSIITTDIDFYEANELKLLKEQKIKSIKLDKFEKVVENGFTLKEYAKCLISK